MEEDILKRMLSVWLIVTLLLVGLSASATEIPDFSTWLADKVGDAQYSTTQSFLNTLNEYSVPYIFLGKIANDSEYVTIDNHDSANNLSYTFNVSFSQDLNSATITVFDLLTFKSEEYSVAMDICKAIDADYGTALFVPIENDNSIALAHKVDLSECENAGIQVLAVILDISKIIAEEYNRFAPIIHDGVEIKNTSTPEPTPTPTPIPTATPTPVPTATPIPVSTYPDDSFELAGRNWTVSEIQEHINALFQHQKDTTEYYAIEEDEYYFVKFIMEDNSAYFFSIYHYNGEEAEMTDESIIVMNNQVGLATTGNASPMFEEIVVALAFDSVPDFQSTTLFKIQAQKNDGYLNVENMDFYYNRGAFQLLICQQ